MSNASMELIPGMDKLLNHMKEQDKKIKELQEENKKLKQENTELEEENKKLKDASAEEEEEEEEEDEYTETISSIEKQKYMTVFTSEEVYRIYEEEEDVAIRQDDAERGRLIFNGEGDPDSIKFIIDFEYELKEGERVVEYWED